jgi:cysteine desulfurase/selenocysteine lyase
MAATTTVMHLLDAGAHVVAVNDVYGGTYRLFSKVYEPKGYRFTYVTADECNAGLDSRLEGAAMLWLETPTNPLLNVVDLRAASEAAHAAGAIVVVDGAQAVPQLAVDVAQLDADFYAWTGHKAYGPTGIGVLHGRHELLDAMPPFIGGGHMIRTVAANESTWTDLPWKFEAGTSQIAEAIGLGAAVDWIREIGIEWIRDHEEGLVDYALQRLSEVPGLTVFGPAGASDRGALISFALEGAHPHDVAEILGRDGICVRAGHHCAQPLMRRLGVSATTRASFAVHNSFEDVERLAHGLRVVRRVLAL